MYRAGIYGFRPFCRIAQDQNGFAERRGFFLDAAGIGEDETAMMHKVGKGFVFHGVDEVDTFDAGQLFFDYLAYERIAVNREDDFRVLDFFYNLAQRLVDMAHGFAQVFPAVRRQKDNAVVLEIHIFQSFRRKIVLVIDGLHEGVNDGVACDIYVVRVYTFA